jgi:hypothetical protein
MFFSVNADADRAQRFRTSRLETTKEGAILTMTTTTVASPHNSTQPEGATHEPHEPHEDWPTAGIVALRIAALREAAQTQRRPRYIEPRRRPFWVLDAARRDEVLGSTATFLVSLAIALALSGVMTYFAAHSG